MVAIPVVTQVFGRPLPDSVGFAPQVSSYPRCTAIFPLEYHVYPHLYCEHISPYIMMLKQNRKPRNFSWSIPILHTEMVPYIHIHTYYPRLSHIIPDYPILSHISWWLRRIQTFMDREKSIESSPSPLATSSSPQEAEVSSEATEKSVDMFIYKWRFNMVWDHVNGGLRWFRTT